MQIRTTITNKKGAWDKQELGELILSIAVIAVSLFLFLAILSPTFNPNREAAKSYLALLEEQLVITEDEGKGEFHMWPIPVRSEQAELFLVHFAQELTVEHKGNTFISEDTNKYQLCICTLVGGKTKCEECEDLKEPASLEGTEESWVIEKGVKLLISEEANNEYLFTRKERGETA